MARGAQLSGGDGGYVGAGSGVGDDEVNVDGGSADLESGVDRPLIRASSISDATNGLDPSTLSIPANR